MLSDYLSKKLKQARYKILKDGSYFGEILGLKGVWANAPTREDCREELEEVLEDWLFLKIRDRESVPGLEFKIDRRNLTEYA
ncbi:MAG: type II toxin-antitoxin system HicB family antitoxin [Parcubacteria group bacterium]|nr:type II toxin-antitoxin system HicB family antitoxin [Parcubacteria group bacterium]